MSDTGKTASNGKQQREQEAPPSAEFFDQVVEATVARVKEQERPNPFLVRSWDDMVAWAERWARSPLCPAGYRTKPDDIIIAVETGRELGLTEIQSLKSIIVVNGRASLTGEAVMALCKGRKDAMGRSLVVDHIERLEGDPNSDDYTATCIVHRRGYPTPLESRYSKADARRADHLRKETYVKYLGDMLLWKVRHRAFHAAFPDILMGFGTAELDRAEEDDRPLWTMPMPERAWANTGTMSPWLASWNEKMVAESANAWQWMQVLLGALKECPTQTDLAQLSHLDMVKSTVAKAPPEAKQSIDEAFAAADARLATTPEPTSEPEPPQPPKPRTRAAKPAPAAQSAAAAPGPAPEEAQADPQSSEPIGAGFDAFLLDEQGDPVGEPHSTIDSFMRAFMAAWERSPLRLSLIEQNSDALDICVAPGSELAEMIAAERAGAADDIPFEEEATWQPAAVPVPQAAGKPAWAEYCRNMRSALDAVPPAHFLDWFASQSVTLAGAPQSTRLQITKQNLEYCQRHGIEPPKTANGNGNGHAAQAAPPPVDATKPDKDLALCEAFCGEIANLKSAGDVTRFTNGLHVSTPFKRWQRERPELAEQLRGTAELRIADLTSMAG